MTNDTAEPNPLRGLAILMTALAVAAAVGIAWRLLPPSRIAPGELITSPGRYRSPDGESVLTLRKTEDQNRIVVEVRKDTAPVSGAKWEIEATTPWFFAFDARNKVWGYGGSLGPHSYNPEGPFTHIGIGGGWSGISESILKELPQDDRETHARWLANQTAQRE